MTADETAPAWQYADVWDVIAECRPGAAALIHGDRRTTWAEFRDRAARLGRSLVSGGAARGDRVAQYLYNCPEYLEVSYATYQAGLTPVNTNYRYRADELRYLWDNADAVAVVFHGSFADTVDQVRADVPTVRRWLWVDDGGGDCPPWAEPYEDVVGAGADGPYRAPWGRSGDDIVMIYTGGTTGMPKGVMWLHDDMYRSFNAIGDPDVADLEAIRARLAAGGDPPVGIPASPLMHATGYMFAKSMLVQGGTVVTLPDRRFDATALLDAIDREGVTAMAIVGDAFALPMLEALDAATGRWDLSSLQLLVSAGVMWSAEVKAGLARHLPTTLFADLLGSTEAHGLGSSVSGAGTDPSTATFSLGAHAMVIDPDAGTVVGPGGTGMVAVAGPCPIGYHKDPEKTAATFRIVDGQRVSVPGDWARVEGDGRITLLGRGSLCINTAGEKVFPEEVEEALETHPAVRDSTVVGVPDTKYGQAVAAVVALRDGADVTPDELIAHVKGRLAGYKAPRHVVVVPDVGRAPNGKADYAGAKRLVLDHLGDAP
ncbi:AMP-binding protein [Actinomarinicola tropica]|uniref:AMP-binding protein n=1 Tax=Actinomarinicola tropica TaxID=2789776 RepID=A0A5Q2RJ54_9ACTN|nr:AMP-binding protein [Actinomarinicola tropica]QGG94047.1 AMP-binding protein [Actinomarinicola tropica]